MKFYPATWYYRKSTLLEKMLEARGGMNADDIMREMGLSKRLLSALIQEIRKRRKVLTLTRPTRYEVVGETCQDSPNDDLPFTYYDMEAADEAELLRGYMFGDIIY